MKFLNIFLFVLLAQLSHAQLLDGNDGNFNRGDTLRGYLSPERTCFDVHYYNLYLDLDFEERSIIGYNDIYYGVVNDFETIQLDLFDNMLIDSVVFKGIHLN